MPSDDLVRQRYLGSGYAKKNPTWDLEDSPWKARQVLRMIRAQGLNPRWVVEVGCGAGGVLAELRDALPDAKFHGYDIAPGAARFWAQHGSARIEFTLGDFLEQKARHYDLLLLLDVIEHLTNPFDFLSRVRRHAAYFIFHFPLDLSAMNVVRERPLLHARNKVGHIHYFTKGLALALLDDCGYQVKDWFYTGAGLSTSQRNWKTLLMSLPRRLVYAISKDAGVRLLGGETLLVLAELRNVR